MAAGTAAGGGSGSRRKWPSRKDMDPEGGSPVGSIVGVSPDAGHTRRQLSTDGIRRWGPRRGALDRSRREDRGPESQTDLRTAAAYCRALSGRCDARADAGAGADGSSVSTRAPSCSPVDRGHRLEAGGSEAVRRAGDGVGSWGGEERRTMTLIPPMGWAGLGLDVFGLWLYC